MTCLLRRMLGDLGRERAVRAQLRAIAGEQAALRRVAALAARGAAPGAVFAAVAEVAGNVLPGADLTMVGRYDAGHAVEVAGGWSRADGCLPAGRRLELGGQDVSTLVFTTGRPARVDDLASGGAVTGPGLRRGCARRRAPRSAPGPAVGGGDRGVGTPGRAAARRRAPAGRVHRVRRRRDRLRLGAGGAGGLPGPHRRHGR